MSDFERGEGSLDNLGNPSYKFTPVEEFANEGELTPDEILMQKEDEEEKWKKEKREEDSKVYDGSEKSAKIIDFDEDPSNWEDDVEMGKYDDGYVQKDVENETLDTRTAVPLKERQNIVQIEEMKDEERESKYFDEAKRKPDNAKKDRVDGGRDSIRFDEAV